MTTGGRRQWHACGSRRGFAVFQGSLRGPSLGVFTRASARTVRRSLVRPWSGCIFCMSEARRERRASACDRHRISHPCDAVFLRRCPLVSATRPYSSAFCSTLAVACSRMLRYHSISRLCRMPSHARVIFFSYTYACPGSCILSKHLRRLYVSPTPHVIDWTVVCAST